MNKCLFTVVLIGFAQPVCAATLVSSRDNMDLMVKYTAGGAVVGGVIGGLFGYETKKDGDSRKTIIKKVLKGIGLGAAAGATTGLCAGYMSQGETPVKAFARMSRVPFSPIVLPETANPVTDLIKAEVGDLVTSTESADYPLVVLRDQCRGTRAHAISYRAHYEAIQAHPEGAQYNDECAARIQAARGKIEICDRVLRAIQSILYFRSCRSSSCAIYGTSI